MSGGPYLSSEDSALFREVLSRYSGGVCLEIGAGNGGGLKVLADRFDYVVGTDLVRPSMDDWKGGADLILADAASPLADSSFDLVAFNPPYLRGDVGDPAVDGGRSLEVPIRFLREALRVVRDGGRVLMLIEEGDRRGFDEVCRARGFGLRKVAERRLFFEKLAVYEASPLAS